MNYDAYVALFNSGDDATLVATWFTEDCVMTGAGRQSRGQEELLAFLHWAHDGVREVMRPQQVMRQGDSLFAEIDMDFIATKRRTDFPFGDLHPGDIMTVKFFVTYKLRDGLIAELNSMTWPAERGVTKAPMLGSHPGQRASYFAYAQAFSEADMDRAGRYYTDDCTLDLSSLPPFNGKQAIVDFYAAMFRTVRETLTVHHLVMDDEGIFGDLTSTFTAIADAPDFVVAPLKKGEAVAVRVFVHYALRDGQIAAIKVTRAGNVEQPAA